MTMMNLLLVKDFQFVLVEAYKFQKIQRLFQLNMNLFYCVSLMP
jgi:hypothetical protein